MRLTVSVLIATINRPDYVQGCLDHLLVQDPKPDQIVVIDASADDRSKIVTESFPGVVYVANPTGRGNLPNSRNAGIKVATGDIIAFLDDDAYAHPGWLKNLLDTFDDPSVGAVAGRSLNNQPGEETEGVNEIGQIRSNGVICGNFAANPGKIIEVDHMLGANMSYRREVICKLGGFRDDIPSGPSALCEDTDMSLRVKRAGYRIFFNPFACADHLAAPQYTGKRFDYRYAYFIRRNQLMMYIRNFGYGRIVLRYVAFAGIHSLKDLFRRIGGAVVFLAANIAGVAMGIFYGSRFWLRERRNPLRQNGDSADIRRNLESLPKYQTSDNRTESEQGV